MDKHGKVIAKILNPAFHVRKLKNRMLIFNNNLKYLKVGKLVEYVSEPGVGILQPRYCWAFHNLCGKRKIL